MPVPTSTLIIEAGHSMDAKTETTSSASGHSQSPSPELQSPAATSSNASPISVPTLLYNPPAASEEQETDQRSTRSTPTRSTVDLTRAQSASKGGCWINCLGWGPKRPDWMRDKEKVAEYKAAIKEKLTREGLIRGQPRSAYRQHASSNVVPSQQYQTPAVAGPGPNTMRRAVSGNSVDYNFRQSYTTQQFQQTAGLMSVLPGAAPPDSDVAPMSSFVEPALNDPLFYVSPTLPVASHSDNLPFDAFLSGNEFVPQTGSTQGIAPVLDSSTNQEDYIVYYFQNVRKLQFVFAGTSLTNTLYSILVSEPRGALSNAISALASLHHARTRIVQGLDAPNRNPERSMPKYFYDQAVFQLMNSKTMNGRYTETDAITAVYLIAFSTLSGGSTNWTTMLEVACDWLAQTGLHEEQNPKLTLLGMTPAGRFAARATMWVDVMSSVTLMQPPRFLSLYRRMFGGGGAGYWSSTNEHFDLRMDKLTGCPDEAVLALAETAALAHWKATEQRNGTLSVRELIRRGDEIERTLKQRPASRSFSDMDKGSPGAQTPPFSSPELAGGLAAALPQSPLATGPDSSSPSEDMRRVVAKIYRETAVLYLNTVLNDSHPGVPEITNSVNVLSDLLQRLPVSDFDRAVIFPLTLTGCMSEDPFMRELVKQRCTYHHDDYVGNMYQARTLVESVWNRRTSIMSSTNHRGTPIDWRESLRDRFSNLLLV
ncbi:hypothetical protein NLI96_g6000 [Meripilus lineatus]|uniref:Uncharacterized protein n=1 Tax=Meripilus lineatus TaxID=2056292 RepID=A0AAD5V2H9_9APHY|nr:hypothetical protein NLI96_g6000 [Physisporinus lineatus]